MMWPGSRTVRLSGDRLQPWRPFVLCVACVSDQCRPGSTALHHTIYTRAWDGLSASRLDDLARQYLLRYFAWQSIMFVPCSSLSLLMAAAVASLPSMVIFSGMPWWRSAFFRNRSAASLSRCSVSRRSIMWLFLSTVSAAERGATLAGMDRVARLAFGECLREPCARLYIRGGSTWQTAVASLGEYSWVQWA